MKQKPSPPHRTTVLQVVGDGRRKPPAVAPNKRGGTRQQQNPDEKRPNGEVAPMWPGHEEPGWRILAFPKRLLFWRTLENRPRQLRDEGMSGVNQHAYIRLIYRRFVLLVP